jgi:hypothetical protein
VREASDAVALRNAPSGRPRAGSRRRADERVTFVIHGKSRPISLPVVVLFDELKIEIEAMWMLRQKRTRNARISITVQMGSEASRKVEVYLSKIEGVFSVKMGAALTEGPPDGRE